MKKQRHEKKLADQLVSINEFLLIVALVWDKLYYLNNQVTKLKELTEICFHISLSLKESVTTDSRDIANKDISAVITLSHYIETMASNLFSIIKGKDKIRDTKAV